jgi:putative transposase
MNGKSSRKIQEEFPQLGKRYWGKHFWDIDYAAFSSGHVTDDMICIKDHKQREFFDPWDYLSPKRQFL